MNTNRQTGKTSRQLTVCLQEAAKGRNVVYFVNGGAVPYTQGLLRDLAIKMKLERLLPKIELKVFHDRALPLRGYSANTWVDMDHFLIER